MAKEQTSGDPRDIPDAEVVETALIAVPDIQLGVLKATTPSELIEAAQSIADPLADIIKKKKLFSIISGREYVKCEGWTTLATMLGVWPVEVANDPQEDGSYVATVELRRIGDQTMLTRATAECGGPDESLWQNRPPYARRSMASTRATGKACRLAFSWIMALAGYSPTPAEEMDGVGHTPPDEPHRESASGNMRTDQRGNTVPADAPQGNGDTLPTCPNCGMDNIRKSTFDDPEYYCWRKKGGCGASFPFDSEQGRKFSGETPPDSGGIGSSPPAKPDTGDADDPATDAKNDGGLWDTSDRLQPAYSLRGDLNHAAGGPAEATRIVNAILGETFGGKQLTDLDDAELGEYLKLLGKAVDDRNAGAGE